MALGLLVSSLTLTAAILTRHLQLLGRMDRVISADALALSEMAHEAVARRHSVVLKPTPAGPGYSVQKETKPIELKPDPAPAVSLDQVIERATGSFRGKEFSESISAGFLPVAEKDGS